MKTNTREVLEKLTQPFNVPIEFLGTQIDLDKVRLRDGAKVIEELRRLATENGYYIYETRDGKLRVTDDIGPGQGDALILGQNILSFSASQDEANAQSEITVKGQRTDNDIWGEEAILKNTTKVFKDSWVPSYAPVVVQLYGNGTEEALERRGRFEANKRSSRSKTITIDVFHVMAQGQPWDIGNLHYVEVPPEGIFDTFECTGLSYSVDAQGTLQTQLTLSPPSTGQQTTSGLDVFENAESSLPGVARKGALGITFAPGSYPFPWAGPTLTALAAPEATVIVGALSAISGLEAAAAEGQPSSPPLSLPAEFEE
jgi:prophage tail gpP-like protein